MFSDDPRINPNTANVVTASNMRQPYARRSINAIIGFALALVLMGGFLGWYFFSPVEEGKEGISQEQAAELQAKQMPGNAYEEGSGRSSVYNFFYKVFGGIEDGLENNSLNENMRERYEQMSMDTSGTLTTDNPILAIEDIAERQAAYLEALSQDEYRHSVKDVVGSDVRGRSGNITGTIHDILVHKETGKAKAVIINEDDARYERDLTAIKFSKVMKQQSDGDIMTTVLEDTIEDKPDFNYSSIEDTNFVSLRQLHDGQLLDFENNVTGQIDAVIYENAEAQSLYFSLRPRLAQEGISKFSLPFDEINIVENADGYDIKLSKEQTLALAKALLD